MLDIDSNYYFLLTLQQIPPFILPTASPNFHQPPQRSFWWRCQAWSVWWLWGTGEGRFASLLRAYDMEARHWELCSWKRVWSVKYTFTYKNFYFQNPLLFFPFKHGTSQKCQCTFGQTQLLQFSFLIKSIFSIHVSPCFFFYSMCVDIVFYKSFTDFSWSKRMYNTFTTNQAVWVMFFWL